MTGTAGVGAGYHADDFGGFIVGVGAGVLAEQCRASDPAGVAGLVMVVN